MSRLKPRPTKLDLKWLHFGFQTLKFDTRFESSDLRFEMGGERRVIEGAWEGWIWQGEKILLGDTQILNWNEGGDDE